MKTAIVSTLNSSPNVTRDFIRYHRNIGIDRMYLFFDYAEPGHVPELDDPDIVAYICDDDHYRPIAAGSAQVDLILTPRQIFNANRGLEQARADAIDWLFHIDSDELIYVPSGQVKDLFPRNSESFDQIVLYPAEALPSVEEPDAPWIQLQHFKDQIFPFFHGWMNMNRKRFERISWLQESLLRVMGTADEIVYGRYFRGHTIGKCGIRIQSRVKSMDIHRAKDSDELRSFCSSRGRVLHFDVTSFDSWKQKFERRRLRHGRVGMAGARQKVFEDFEVAMDSGDETMLRNLYRRLYGMDDWTFRKLSLVGLTRRITGVRDVFERG